MGRKGGGGPSRGLLESRLPFTVGDIAVRAARRADVDLRADWPSYEAPWEVFNAHARAWEPDHRDRAWAAMAASPDEVFLACETAGVPLLAWFALREVDWAKGRVGSLSIRLHPGYLDRGLGTVLCRGIFSWLHGQGLRSLRLDVLASNARAVRCYEKAGMARIGEFEKRGAAFLIFESRAPG